MSAARDLIEAYTATAPADAAMGLAALETAEAAEVLADVDAKTAARLLQLMSREAAAEFVRSLREADLGAISREMPAEVLAAIVRRLGEAVPTVLEALDSDVAESVRRLLEYPDGTAGAALDPLVTAVQATAPAGDVRAQLGRETARVADYVYAVDEENVLRGVVNLAALVEADADAPVSSVTRPGIDWVRVEMPLAAVEAHPGWQRYDALPVVDAAERLVGVIRHRRLRQLAHDGAVTSRDDRGMRTLMALGEVYWLGLSGLLQGLASAAAAPAETREGETR